MIQRSGKICLLLFLLSGLAKHMVAEESRHAVYVQYANEVINQFDQDMKKELGLVCRGSGGKMPYDVEELDISFIAYQRATIEQARDIEVYVTERFLQAINSNEKIRPFLREYPFTVPRVEVAISFNKPDNSRYTDGSVAYLSVLNGKIFYRSEDPKTENLVDLMNEPYEEALKLVKNNPPKMENSLNPRSLKNIFRNFFQ